METYNARRTQDKYFSCAIAYEFILLLAQHSSSPWHWAFRQTSGISPLVRKAAEAASFYGSQECILDASRRNVSPATVHVERKLYRQLSYGDYRRAQCVNAFPPFLFSIFPPQSAPHLTRLDSDEADEGEGLETKVHKAFWNLSEFQKRCEALGTTTLFFRVKFLVELMHFEANNVRTFEIWKTLLVYFILSEFSVRIWRNRIYVSCSL